MDRTLLCWIGRTDLRAMTAPAEVGDGPIAQAVATGRFRRVALLANDMPDQARAYAGWLRGRHPEVNVGVHVEPLPTPTDFEAIYRAARRVLRSLADEAGPDSRTFHLSPGTPAMAAVWIILAKTAFPAELIESSREHGVKVVALPFDLAADFLPDLLPTQDRELERLTAGAPPEAPEFAALVHRSSEMRRVVARARIAAPRTVAVLIEGESGTGKELLARAIHRASPRAAAPFVAVNCGALPESLVEAELFGYERGAFTGAQHARKGVFEAAHGGTLFLDEVGELPLLQQVKLLRALQERAVTPLGATRPRPVDVRVIGATNRDLFADVAAGRFREDLFYRLAVAVLRVPPLRERQGDVGLLADTLLAQVNAELGGGPARHKKLSASARNLLLSHTWPGNVRELQNTLIRAAIWSGGTTLTASDIKDALISGEVRRARTAAAEGDFGSGFDIRKTLASIAADYLERAMEQASGNKTRAARLLGLPSYQTLTNWLKRYGLAP